MNQIVAARPQPLNHDLHAIDATPAQWRGGVGLSPLDSGRTASLSHRFGDDERGRKTAWYFVPFHFNFFHRWRPLSEDRFGAFEIPLIQNGRAVDAALEEIEGPRAALAPLEQLLRSVWKSISEWTLHTVEQRLLQGQHRVDGLKTPRHRADLATETTSRRWSGAPEI